MYAMLGDIRFELLDSFTSYEETHSAVFAKHDVLAGRPRLQATGNDLTTIRFGMLLHWKLANPDNAYNALISAKEAQQALALVFGSGRFAGWFVIQQLSSTTLIQDAKGRTAAREISVELLEFVGDPNNPLPTPGIMTGQNPLLAFLPESVKGAVNKVSAAVQTGVRIYHSVEQNITDIQNLITRARTVQHNTAGWMGLIADVLSVGGQTLNKLNTLPEIGEWFGNLAGAADFLSYTGQAACQLQTCINLIQTGYDSGEWGDWLNTSEQVLATVEDSIGNATAGTQSLTAWLAARKDEV